jgi:4,4'-diaponeurosporenoate glycosyltransferase
VPIASSNAIHSNDQFGKMIASLLIIVPLLALMCAPALFLVLGRPNFAPVIGKRCDTPISIIIPARNEAENISTLLGSITKQEHPAHEIIVVDDGSTDGTATIALENGASVVEAESLPPSWKGKPWACQQGADHATGDWLLFLDADTCIQPDFLGRMQYVTSSDTQVFSVCPYHTVLKPYEQLSAFFNLLMVAGVNAFGTGSSSGKHAAMFGQCMLISRKHYDQVNGHQQVKDKVLENFHLASHLEKLGIQCRCYLGKGLISMRMFPGGFTELWSSWKKGFVSGATSANPRALAYSSIWISGAMITIVSLALLFTPQAGVGFGITTAIAYTVYAAQCYWAFRLVGSFSWINALLFPISLIFYQVLFFSAVIDKARGKQTQWKGRQVN